MNSYWCEHITSTESKAVSFSVNTPGVNVTRLHSVIQVCSTLEFARKDLVEMTTIHKHNSEQDNIMYTDLGTKMAQNI